MQFYPSSVELKLKPDANPKAVKQALQEQLGAEFRVLTRYESNSIYRLMALEKWGVFAVAMMVMAIASLSVVGTLVMVIIDKRDDIATLRTLGAKQSLVQAIFANEGRLMALISLTVGVVIGIILTLTQQYLGVVRLNTSTLLVDAYPVELHLWDVVATIAAYITIAHIIIRVTVRQTLKTTVYEENV